MIKVMIGEKGTGKTKILIDSINKTANSANGNVVFIGNDTKRHMYDLDHKVRMVCTSEFDIGDYSEFYGFICGIISNNFDITDVYIDSIFKIVNNKMEGLEVFFKQVEKLTKEFDISFFFTISMDPVNAPGYLIKYA